MNVKELIKSGFEKLTPQSTIRKAITIFRKSYLHGIPVVDQNDQLIGMFTVSNLYDCLLKDINIDTSIENYYVREVFYFRDDKEFADLNQLTQWLQTVRVGQTPVIDSDNHPVGIITKTNAVIELLNRTEILNKELSSIMEKVPVGVIATDEYGYMTVINNYAQNMFEAITAGQHIGVFISDLQKSFVPVENGEWITPRKIECLSFPLIASAVPIFQNSKFRGSIFVLQSLTDINAIAHELNLVKDLQKMLETVLEVAYEGVAVLDDKGNVVLANGNFAQGIGKAKEEIIGRNVQKFMELRGDELPLSVKEVNSKPCIISCLPYNQEGVSDGMVIKLYRDLDQLSEVMQQLDYLSTQLDYYKDELYRINGTRYNINSIIVKNEELMTIKSRALQVARTNSTVLIEGESGTGKELFAHSIHNASQRQRELFIKVNCAAIPAELAESELFGYEDGAFTGARKRGKPGKFELANGGTIFLDEIGEMPMILQSKLLRIIQEKEVERVGGVKTRKIDVRIIAATNKDLRQLVREGKFREDLFFRLNVVELKIPPLRKRKEDIPILVDNFILKFNNTLNKNVSGISKEAMNLLVQYHWPGNIRELENVIERIFNYVEKGPINVEDVPIEIRGGQGLTVDKERDELLLRTPVMRLEDIEQEAIRKALKEANGNKSEAARILGISRSKLYEKLARLGE